MRQTHLLFIATTCLLLAPPMVLGRDAPSGWVEDDTPKTTTPKVIKGPDGKITLQGGVQHSADLPPLPTKFKVGSVFNESALVDTRKEESWYEIPAWFAGQWLREEETIISTYHFDTQQQNNQQKTIALRETADFGVQKDKLGHVWHYRLATKGLADKGSVLSVAYILREEPMEITDKKVVLKDTFIEMQVNKGNNVIIDSVQAESITTYTFWKDGMLRTTASIKFFNEDGSPKAEQRNVSFEKLATKFKPEDTYKGVNLRQAFAAYLHSINKDDLIP